MPDHELILGPLDAMIAQLAASANWQSWTHADEAGDPAAAAALHIFLQEPPPEDGTETYTKEELETRRPWATVGLFVPMSDFGGQPVLSNRVGELAWAPSGRLLLAFEADTPDELRKDHQKALRWFYQKVSGVWTDLKSPDTASATLAIRSLEILSDAARVPVKQRETMGDYWKILFLIAYGLDKMAKAKIQYLTGTPSQRLRAAITAVTAGLKAALEHWHDKYLPIHFQPQGAQRYGYQKRSGEDEPAYVYSNRDRGRTVIRKGISRRLIKNPKYYWRKKREGHGTTALVRTGETAREAMAGIRLSTRKNAGGGGDGIVRATGAMNVPKYFYQRLMAGSYMRATFDGQTPVIVGHDTPDKYKELTTLTMEEQQEMRDIVTRTAMSKLLAPQSPRTVKV